MFAKTSALTLTAAAFLVPLMPNLLQVQGVNIVPKLLVVALFIPLVWEAGRPRASGAEPTEAPTATIECLAPRGGVGFGANAGERRECRRYSGAPAQSTSIQSSNLMLLAGGASTIALR